MAEVISQIPVIYRILFLWIDPIMALLGGCVPCVLAPDTFANSYVPQNVSRLNPLYKVFFWQLAAMFFLVFWIQAVLLRYTENINVWRLVNAGLLGYDLFLLSGSYYAFTSQRRTNPAKWRATDWFALGSTITIATIRASIVGGIGLDF